MKNLELQAVEPPKTAVVTVATREVVSGVTIDMDVETAEELRSFLQNSSVGTANGKLYLSFYMPLMKALRGRL